MLTLIAFIGAQLLLGGCVAFGLKVARQEPNLTARLADILEITNREAREEAARQELEWARLEISSVQDQIDRARRRLADFIPLPDAASTIVSFALLTMLLFEADAAVALLLNNAAGFAGLSTPELAFFSPIMTAGLFVMLDLILGALVQIGAEHRPLRVYRRARWGTVASGVIVILAAWAVLSGRSFGDPRVIEMVAAWGLLTLALTLSLAGTFATIVVTTLFGERALERRIARLETLRTALERHVGRVQRDIEKHQQQGPRPRKVAALLTMGSATAFLLVVLYSGAALAADFPQDPVKTRQAAGVDRPAEPVIDAASRSCEFLVDVSRSLSADARGQAVEQVSSALDFVAPNFGCRLLRFSAFSGEVPFNVVRETPLLPPAVTALDPCRDVVADAKNGAVEGAIDRIYPAVAMAKEADARKECLTNATREHNDEIQAWNKAIGAARATWREVSRTAAVGNCTALDYAIQEALVRSHHVFVLTDGQNSCPIPGGVEAERLKPSASCERTLVFVIVPSTMTPGPAIVRDRMARLRARFPIGDVRFGSTMTPSQWQALRPQSPSSSSCSPTG